MVRMAVMGDTESIKGFAAVGLDIYPCDDPQEAVRRFRSLTGGEYGVIYITEAIFSLLDKEIRKLDEQPLPAVIPIPGLTGDTGIGVRRLSESVEPGGGLGYHFRLISSGNGTREERRRGKGGKSSR